MGNSFCRQCNCNNKDEIDNLSKYNIKYNSENNLYYTEIKEYDDKEELYKYKTTPGPPVIIRNKEAYLNVLRII
uniref:Uncharacterized protein n=1 Tax=viral metagenome TaxID=1070528 RepID=A0A6C0C468_9ZZZZ